MKKIMGSFFLLMLLTPHLCFSGERDSAVSLVKNYVNDMGKNILEKGAAFQKYYHPDYALLGGEKLNYVVVCEKFKVRKVHDVYEDRNIIHPGKEKLVAVEIVFDQIGQFDGYHKVHIKKEKWVKTFYCSKSTGKYLILDTTDNEAMWCFRDSAITWLMKNISDGGASEKIGANKKAIADLKSSNCDRVMK